MQQGNVEQRAILVIGVGNPLRGDDGAGASLAEALHKAMAEQGKASHLWRVQQLLPELAEEIADAQPQTVIIADCRSDAGSPTVQRIDPIQQGAGSWRSHSLPPTQLLALARKLYGFGGEAWLVTVPCSDFGHGEGLSKGVRDAIQHLVPTLAEQF